MNSIIYQYVYVSIFMNISNNKTEIFVFTEVKNDHSRRLIFLQFKHCCVLIFEIQYFQVGLHLSEHKKAETSHHQILKFSLY